MLFWYFMGGVFGVVYVMVWFMEYRYMMVECWGGYY